MERFGMAAVAAKFQDRPDPSGDEGSQVTSMQKVSAAAQRTWGSPAIEAVRFLAPELAKDGFEGPVSWTKEPSLAFVAHPTPLIQMVVDVAYAREGPEGKVVDGFVILRSKTLMARAEAEGEPFRDPDEKWLRGYASCLSETLSHRVWCEAPAPENPRWNLVLGGAQGVENFLSKFRQHFLPVYSELQARGDASLLRMLERAQSKSAPEWVLSAGAGFARLDFRVGVLRRALES